MHYANNPKWIIMLSFLSDEFCECPVINDSSLNYQWYYNSILTLFLSDLLLYWLTKTIYLMNYFLNINIILSIYIFKHSVVQGCFFHRVQKIPEKKYSTLLFNAKWLFHWRGVWLVAISWFRTEREVQCQGGEVLLWIFPTFGLYDR